MHRGMTKLISLCALVALVATGACGKDDSQMQELEAARQAALEEIESAKEALDAKRAELAEMRAIIADPEGAQAETSGDETSGAEGGEEAEPVDVEALEAEAEALKNEIDSAADELGRKIVEFINEDPPVVGEPLNPVQQRAIDIKVDEDILLAREYIEVGGDHKRAISILEQIQPLAGESARLSEALEQAKADRWMTEERFTQAEKGQTEQEVRALLGQVNLRNVKEYPDRGVTAWFYMREGGGAAGVYFKESNGDLVVYKTDFNAVEPESDTEDAEL